MVAGQGIRSPVRPNMMIWPVVTSRLVKRLRIVPTKQEPGLNELRRHPIPPRGWVKRNKTVLNELKPERHVQRNTHNNGSIRACLRHVCGLGRGSLCFHSWLARHAGRLIIKVVWPSLETHPTVPSWASTNDLTIASPNPAWFVVLSLRAGSTR